MDNLLTEQKKSSELIDSIRAEHKKNMSLKRGLIGMGCFAVLLAIANIGTSFVAVRLVKDMKVGDTNDLTTMDGQRVGTTSKLPVFTYDEPANTDLESRRRHLAAMEQAACWNIGFNNKRCDLLGVLNFQKSMEIYQELCNAWQPNYTPNFAGSRCVGGGASNVLLDCNGVRSEIKGGFRHVPAEGPSIVDDGVWPYWSFPSKFGTYTVEEPVWFANETLRTSQNDCLLTYDLSVVCPTDGTECGYFATYDETICPDRYPQVCMPFNVSSEAQ